MNHDSLLRVIVVAFFTTVAAGVASADNCAPYSYFPPTIDAHANSVAGVFDINLDGRPDLVTNPGLVSLMPDGSGGLTIVDLLTEPLVLSQNFLGYLNYDDSPDIISVARSDNYQDMFLILYASDVSGDYSLEDIVYVGNNQTYGGATAFLRQSPLRCCSSGQVVFVINDETGCTASVQVVYDDQFETTPFLNTHFDFRAHSPQLVDLDDDNWPDLVLQTDQNEVVTILRSGLSIPSTIDAVVDPGGYINSMLVIDLDGDDIPEIVLALDDTLKIFVTL